MSGSTEATRARHTTRRTRRRWLILSAGLFAAYLGSYLWLSRAGYAEADRYCLHGFYYFLPEESRSWRVWNYGCVALYWPLNVLDCWLGTGREPASEPLWRLGK